jgi:hypothetical protein
MNSLPFISHQLFVAAVANDGHAAARSTLNERLRVEPAEPMNRIGLGVIDVPKALPAGSTRPARALITEAQS